MSVIPNYPRALLDEHHKWHDPAAHPGTPGGRPFPAGRPGAGRNFLQFHRDYVRRFRQWYDNQPFADQTAVEPWAEIPAALKSSAVGWNSSLAAQEQRITNDPGSFETDDQLGTYIELGIHNWIHGATATAFNEPSVRDLHSPQSTYFYKIHGLVENWWRQWESGPVISPTTPLTVGAPPAAFSIGRPGEVDRYSFVVPAAGSYTIETQGPTDVVMSLYGPNNLAALVTEDDDSGAGSNARIVSNLTAGTYFVQVRHFNAGATGNYSISVRSGTISVAQIQVNGPAVQGVIAAANESDLYTFTVAAAGLYTIETQGGTDTILTLFGPGSQTLFIAEDDDSGVGSNSRIATNLGPGSHFARVRHFRTSGTGAYGIRVST